MAPAPSRGRSRSLCRARAGRSLAMRTILICLAALCSGLRAAWAADPLTPAYPQILVTFKQAQGATPARTGARAKYFSGTSTYAASPKVDRDVRAIAKEQGLRPVDAWPITPLGV